MRQSGYQVDACRLNSGCSHSLNIPQSDLPVMQPARHRRLAVDERLDSKAYPVEMCIRDRLGILLIDSLRRIAGKVAIEALGEQRGTSKQQRQQGTRQPRRKAYQWRGHCTKGSRKPTPQQRQNPGSSVVLSSPTPLPG